MLVVAAAADNVLDAAVVAEDGKLDEADHLYHHLLVLLHTDLDHHPFHDAAVADAHKGYMVVVVVAGGAHHNWDKALGAEVVHEDGYGHPRHSYCCSNYCCYSRGSFHFLLLQSQALLTLFLLMLRVMMRIADVDKKLRRHGVAVPEAAAALVEVPVVAEAEVATCNSEKKRC